MEVFENGKCYKHTSGMMIKIVGRAKTTLYGDCLVAEQLDSRDLKPVSDQEGAMDGWCVVDESEWDRNFTE